MLLIGRLAKEFGKWPPLRVADEVYHFFPAGYLDQFSPEQRILGDLRILARMNEAENEALKEAQDKAKRQNDHPGCEMDDYEEDWEDRIARLQNL